MSICGEIDQQSLDISMTPLSLNYEEYSGILTFYALPCYLFIYLFIYRFSITNKLATQTYYTF